MYEGVIVYEVERKERAGEMPEDCVSLYVCGYLLRGFVVFVVAAKFTFSCQLSLTYTYIQELCCTVTLLWVVVAIVCNST